MKTRLITASLLYLALVLPAAGQGTLVDYERAAQLRKQTENKVFKTKINPHWFAGGDRFWYRNELAEGRCEFVLVDAVKGKRSAAFDHAKASAALAKAMGKDVDTSRLPIDRIEFLEKEPVVVFYCGAQAWKCNLETYELTAHQGNEQTAEPLSGDPPPRSRASGDESALVFVNRTPAEVEIHWIDTEGNRRGYGKVAPGASYRQHTFAGHAWLATGAEGKALMAFIAGEEPEKAIISDDRPPKPQRRQGPKRQQAPAVAAELKFDAFVKDHNVFLRDKASGEEIALSTDGTEPDAYTGQFFFSPDGKKLAASKTRKGGDRKVYYVESSPKDQLQPKLHSYDYLKPGDEIPLTKPHLFDLEQKKEIAVNDSLFPMPWSLEDIRWAADSSRFTFVYNQRGHQVLRVIAVDALSGAARPIIDEQSPTFIDYAGKYFIRYLDETGEILWMSERDGWNHLYLYDALTGKVKNQVTKGEWVVREVTQVDAEKRQVWFRASGIRPGQDPYYLHECRVGFDGQGLVVLTEGDGTHQIEFSPDRRFVVDGYSRVDLPPVHELRDAADGRLICELERADWSELLKTGYRAPERFVAKGRDGRTDIYGIVCLPTNFDPNKKYPVIEEIYAGPQAAFVPKGFSSYLRRQSLCELGFIVAQCDGMGTSFRSKKFHDVCWKNLGDGGFPDRIAWIKAAAARYAAMDLNRVGIYGGSAGGQNALRAMLAHGDFYKAAVADCGCHDNRMDKIWWNELWMGWPIGPEYEEQSNVTQAHKLEGKLMLVVGEMDENVDPASTMQVVHALVQADKDFDLLVLPGMGHGSAESPYGNRRRMDFFVRNLLGVEPRAR